MHKCTSSQAAEEQYLFSTINISSSSSWIQLITPHWIHIHTEHCCTISRQSIFGAVVVDTTIVHVCCVANTGLVTPIKMPEGCLLMIHQGQ